MSFWHEFKICNCFDLSGHIDTKINLVQRLQMTQLKIKVDRVKPTLRPTAVNCMGKKSQNQAKRACFLCHALPHGSVNLFAQAYFGRDIELHLG